MFFIRLRDFAPLLRPWAKHLLFGKGNGEFCMKIGFLELVVVFVVALVAIGPDKLPSFARKLGDALREFRKVSADVTKDVRENVIEPLEEAQRPIREAMEPLEELDRAVRKDIRDMERDLRNIGKPAAKRPEPKDDPEPQPTPSPEEEAPAGISAEQSDESTGGNAI